MVINDDFTKEKRLPAGWTPPRPRPRGSKMASIFGYCRRQLQFARKVRRATREAPANRERVLGWVLGLQPSPGRLMASYQPTNDTLFQEADQASEAAMQETSAGGTEAREEEATAQDDELDELMAVHTHEHTHTPHPHTPEGAESGSSRGSAKGSSPSTDLECGGSPGGVRAGPRDVDYNSDGSRAMVADRRYKGTKRSTTSGHTGNPKQRPQPVFYWYCPDTRRPTTNQARFPFVHMPP